MKSQGHVPEKHRKRQSQDGLAQAPPPTVNRQTMGSCFQQPEPGLGAINWLLSSCACHPSPGDLGNIPLCRPGPAQGLEPAAGLSPQCSGDGSVR